jgi:hypothetical protein
LAGRTSSLAVAFDSIFKLAMVMTGPRIGRTLAADHEIRPAMWLTGHTAGQFWLALNEKLQHG